MRNLLPPEHKEPYKICWTSINIVGFEMVSGCSDSIREEVVFSLPNNFQELIEALYYVWNNGLAPLCQHLCDCFYVLTEYVRYFK